MTEPQQNPLIPRPTGDLISRPHTSLLQRGIDMTDRLQAWLEQAEEASHAPAVLTPEQEAVRQLRAIMQDRHRPAQERLEAGLRLDDMGVLPEGLDDFLPVPGADFLIGKYPVTNHQFRRFVEAGGYGVQDGERPPWWSEKGWKERQERNWTAPRFWDDAEFNRATQPVVGVSWYEAEAYCNWLNHVGAVPVGYQAQLPSEAQWTLAVRNGNMHAPRLERYGPYNSAKEMAFDEMEERLWDNPWRGFFDWAFANTKRSGLEQTTPVDMYPDGATPAGVYDLAGNVWEWTCDRYTGSESYYLKGGSWWDDYHKASASAAVWYYAFDRLYGWGCRVVVVPISRS